MALHHRSSVECPTRAQGARRRRSLLFFFFGSILIFGYTPAARGDLTVNGYQDRLHDRFYVGADRAFIGETYNWSGVGRIEDPVGAASNWKTLTMISNNWFITDEHHHPTRLDDPSVTLPKVRFYRTNDPGGEYWESELATSGTEYLGTRIGSSDLWVGKLANTPPDWVSRYPLAKRQEGSNYLSYNNRDLFIFGQDSPRSASSVRVGRNSISELSLDGGYSWKYDPATGFGRDEAQTEGGDSGGPSFYVTVGFPVLAGTHTSNNIDTGVSGRIGAIRTAIGEPVSVSTGLPGDFTGNYKIDSADLDIIMTNFSGSHGATYAKGDITGDGRVDSADVDVFFRYFGTSLFAPSDFDRNGVVSASDLTVIGNNWQKSVSKPFTSGDADGNSVVNLADVVIFDRNQRRAILGPLLPPLAPVLGDFDGNGVIDGIDITEISARLNQPVTPGSGGDVNGDGLIDTTDLVYVLLHSGASYGDIDGDLTVGPADFAILAANWNQPVIGGRLQGDLNADGLVSSGDAYVLFQWWGVGAGGFAPIVAPEPSALAMFVIGGGLIGIAAGIRRRV